MVPMDRFTFDSGKGYDSALRITADDSIRISVQLIVDFGRWL